MQRSAVNTPLIIRRDPTSLCIEQPYKQGSGLFRELQQRIKGLKPLPT